MDNFKLWFNANRQVIAWAVVVCAIVIAAFLGVTYPMPPAPTPVPTNAPQVQPTGALNPVFQQNIAVQTLTVRGTALPLPTATPYTAYLGYPAGYSIFCATNTITNTASYTSTTTSLGNSLVGGWCSVNQTATGDARTCNVVTSGITVTVNVLNSALTPASNATGASVFWCAVGR